VPRYLGHLFRDAVGRKAPNGVVVAEPGLAARLFPQRSRWSQSMGSYKRGPRVRVLRDKRSNIYRRAIG
jgi:hypothetical protein